MAYNIISEKMGLSISRAEKYSSVFHPWDLEILLNLLNDSILEYSDFEFFQILTNELKTLNQLKAEKLR